ncbi:MAG TPA: phosphoglycerate dehydrogenase [Terriglobia bacterium]|nr:phosphoglycerate dehydrogenase [Terriglobia bacterium]
MVRDRLIAVTSTAFSKDPYLRERLLERFSRSVFNPTGQRLTRQQLKDFLADAEGAIVGLDIVDEDLLSSCRNLRIVSKYGVGLDNVDRHACEQHGVAIGWTGGVNRLSVAEQTLCFMIALCRNLYQTSCLMKSGQWFVDGGWQLTGKTIGIIGMGHIGKEMVRLLAPFACTILANDILNQSEYYRTNGLVESSKEKIFTESDVVTIHTPLTAETRHLVNRKTLSLMRKTAFLINTSRGGVVNQADLKEALISKMIAGAAADVFEEEPPQDRELIELPNFFCTPHVGGNAIEAIRAMGLSAIDHIENFYKDDRQPR